MNSSVILRTLAAIAVVAVVAVIATTCGDGTGSKQEPSPRASAVSPLNTTSGQEPKPPLVSSAVARVNSPSGEPGQVGLVTAPGGVDKAGGQDNKDAQIGLRWAFSPPRLRVYRATEMAFRLDKAPAGHQAASCSWNFGDGKTAEGCTVSHTFMSGLADEVVTLTLHDGDWEYSSTRTVPLERFKVVKGLLKGADPLANSLAIPDRPKPASNTFRFSVIADTAATGGVPESVTAAIGSLKDRVRPELVIHAGGIASASNAASDWARVDQTFISKLQAGGAKVVMGLGPVDRDTKPKALSPPSSVQLLEGADYPARYAFTHKGVFFMVISTQAGEGGETVTEDMMKWMRTQLGKARIYQARYVVSYLPIRKFSEKHVGTLDKNFRLYELFLRGRVTALFTAAYGVFYKGAYGALDVVSVGRLAGKGGRLLGSDFQQAPTLVSVDIVKGVPKRTFAVEGPDFNRIFDESLLPKTVGMYSLSH